MVYLQQSSRDFQRIYAKVDWMSAIPDDKPLSAVTIPGTHRSMTLYGGPLVQCQAWSLSIQLDAGLRYFDMEVQENFFTKNIEVLDGAIIHQQFREVLGMLRSFLLKHSSETVVLRVKTESRGTIKITKNMMKNDGDVWWEPSVPTMAEVRGKIVFMESQSVNLGVLNRDTSIKGDEYFKNLEKKMKIIVNHLNQAKDICANYPVLTASNGRRYLWIIKTPKSVAKVINPELFKYLNNLLKSPQKPMCLGIIAMDFPGPDLIELIIKFNGKSENSGAKGEGGKKWETGGGGTGADGVRIVEGNGECGDKGGKVERVKMEQKLVRVEMQGKVVGVEMEKVVRVKMEQKVVVRVAM
ncbi:1-phosphatidylinositol phosphodiesterase-like [Anguilla anguilla]|uniref:1-phosphatidylinositol phosphodiesterase-like n=1 Tax=Anguilla anguilla TaxID=7936 RepID=UPI0015AD5693|nr:1-phosphatidylinositol phosphodiesterase-like [Anguilla anguilla]